MSAGYVQHVGDTAIPGTSAISTIVINVANTTTTGNDIVISALASAGTNPTISSVVDSKGNSYVQDAINAGDSCDSVYRAGNATSLVSGVDTITLTVAGSPTNAAIASADEITGIDHSTPLDVTPTSSSNSSTVHTAPAITPVSHSVLIMCFFMWHGPITTQTIGSGLTTAFTGTVTSASTSGQALGIGYLIYDNPGVSTGTFTDTPSNNHSSICFTIAYRPATGVVSVAFSGTGTLAANGTPAITQAVPFSGTGTLTATGTPAIAQAVPFSGTGTLNAQQAAASVAFGSTGTLRAVGQQVGGWLYGAPLAGVYHSHIG